MRHDQAMRAYKPIPMQYVQVLYMAHAEEMPEFPTNAFVPWVPMCQKGIVVHIVAGNHLTMNVGIGAKQLAAQYDIALGASC